VEERLRHFTVGITALERRRLCILDAERQVGGAVTVPAVTILDCRVTNRVACSDLRQQLGQDRLTARLPVQSALFHARMITIKACVPGNLEIFPTVRVAALGCIASVALALWHERRIRLQRHCAGARARAKTGATCHHRQARNLPRLFPTLKARQLRLINTRVTFR
jgi:hypothetical protein